MSVFATFVAGTNTIAVATGWNISTTGDVVTFSRGKVMARVTLSAKGYVQKMIASGPGVDGSSMVIPGDANKCVKVRTFLVTHGDAKLVKAQEAAVKVALGSGGTGGHDVAIKAALVKVADPVKVTSAPVKRVRKAPVKKA